MMKKLILLLLVLVSFSLQAQDKKSQKEVKNDTTLYFYGNFELASGLQVLTEMDTLSVDKSQVISTSAALRARNQRQLLKYTMTQMAEPSLNLKNSNAPLILIFLTKEEMEENLNTLLNTNKNSIYRLMDFKFNKDVELKKGPGNPVIK